MLFADRLERGFLILGVALLPVYLFPSGSIQPAHLVFALFFSFVLLRRGVPAAPWSYALLAIVVYTFLVECVYAITGRDSEVIHSIYFLYNALVAFSVYMYVKDNQISGLFLGLLVASLAAVGTVLISGVNLQDVEDAGRSTGSFNNPNQLGYFSVSLLSLIYLCYRSGYIRYYTAATMFAVALFLSISSLSKAAMVANFLVIFIALKPPSSSIKSTMFWFVIGGFALLLLCFLYYLGAFDNFLFTQRLQNIASENDSSLEARGYFAFLEGNGFQFVFGLGVDQTNQIAGHEVHSTLGGILNNYGVFGFIVFSFALLIWALQLWKVYGFSGMFCLTAPVMLYGLTHNGVRFTIFWLLFAASMAMACRVREINPNDQLLSCRDVR